MDLLADLHALQNAFMDWDTSLRWLLWLVWSLGVTCLTHLVLTAAFQTFLSRRIAVVSALAALPVLFVIGMCLLGLTSFALYGGDPDSLSFRLGYYGLFWSPLGLPMLAGIPLFLTTPFAIMHVRKRPRASIPSPE